MLPRYCIVACSCMCGGDFAWMKRRPSGTWESIGCICHNSPPHPQLNWIRWRYFTRDGWRYRSAGRGIVLHLRKGAP